jgi:hypothetical protein
MRGAASGFSGTRDGRSSGAGALQAPIVKWISTRFSNEERL